MFMRDSGKLLRYWFLTSIQFNITGHNIIIQQPVYPYAVADRQ